MTKRIPDLVVAVVVGMLMTAWADAAEAAQKALVIGVNTYPHLPESKQLTAARADALKVNAFLREEWGMAEQDILLLLDTEATKAAISDALVNWLPDNSDPGDRVIVYFSGHGTQFQDVSGDETDGMDEAFMPSDARRSELDHRLLLDDEIGAAFARLGDREILLIADSCNSGTLSRSVDFASLPADSRLRERYVAPLTTSGAQPPSRAGESLSRETGAHLTLAAAMPYQWAWEEVGGGGIFTRYFLEALTDLRADANGNGVLTSAEVVNYIKPRSEAYCARMPQCSHMGFTPDIDPKNGSFIMARGDASPEPDILDDVTDILPEIDSGTIAIDIQPASRNRIGDEVSFLLTSSVDGYLTLLDVTAGGDLVLLFPTREDLERGKTGRIRADSPLSVPDASYGFNFHAQPPTGKGQLLALVTHDRIDLSGLHEANGDFQPIEDPLAYVQSIAQELHAVWTGDEDANRGASWAIGHQAYEIHE